MHMWALWGIAVAAAFLALLSVLLAKRFRTVQYLLASFALLMLAVSIPFLWLASVFVWHFLLIFYIELFMIFVAVRVFRRASAWSTAINTGGIGAVLAGAYFLLYVPQILLLWSVLVGASIFSIAALLRLRVALLRYRLKEYYYKKRSLEDLPTVSICVPARNETFALASCLDSILASDYPKLEIIVLDDCSQDTTSQLIKSYAHAGVRFIQGLPPKDGWLGRNQALDVLTNQASGDYIVFIDVDTRIEATTISQLIDYTLLKHLSMVSVQPERRDQLRPSVFLSPLRYFWQMIIPQFIHTPAATSLWLVRREKLLEVGGFASVKNDIMPENKFARTFDLRGTYRYLLGGHRLGVFYAKKWSSQIETSLRLSYPALGKRPYVVLITSLAFYLVALVPFIIILYSAALSQWSGLTAVALALTLVYALMYLLYTRQAWHNGWLLATILLPFVLLQELALILASMIGYEFDKITWKGRNICYPVLRRPRS